MRSAIFAILIGSAAAFTAPTMTFAVAKKAPAKKVVAKKAAPKAVAKKVAPKAVAKKVAPKAKAAPKVVAKKAAPKVVAKKAAPKVVAKKAAPKKVVAKKVVAKKVVAKKVVAKKAAPKKVVAKKVAPKKVAPKKVIKKAPPKVVASKPKPVGVVPSTAIPGEQAPALLDGSLVGDVGFDPCFLSTKADSLVPYFNGIFGGKAPLDGLSWYREAELMHGRICMVAVLGFIVPGFTTLSGNEWTGVDAYSYTNPLEAATKAPGPALFQIFAFMSILEFRRINFILDEGASYMPGDAQKWGQGPGRWNPFGFEYTPAEYEEKQLQELKHARLAMIALLGLIFQANASGVGVVDQIGQAFIAPEYVAKAGYFLPEGI